MIDILPLEAPESTSYPGNKSAHDFTPRTLPRLSLLRVSPIVGFAQQPTSEPQDIEQARQHYLTAKAAEASAKEKVGETGNAADDVRAKLLKQLEANQAQYDAWARDEAWVAIGSTYNLNPKIP